MQPVPGREDIVRAQRDVLNALAAILLDELLDLIDLIAPALVFDSLIGMRILPQGEASARLVRPVYSPVMSKYWCS